MKEGQTLRNHCDSSTGSHNTTAARWQQNNLRADEVRKLNYPGNFVTSEVPAWISLTHTILGFFQQDLPYMDN